MSLVIVTGAGGFLGKRLTKTLLKNGHKVIGLARGNYPELEELGVTMYQCDLADKQSIERAFKLINKENQSEVDAIFHTASKVAMWGKWEDFYNTNFIGTKNLVEIAKEYKIKNMIYTSTPSVVFEWDDIENGDESLPYAKDSKSLYAKSKALAEKYVLSQINDDFKACALRPHLIFGEGDQNMIPRLIEAAKKGRLKQVGDGKNKVDVVYIENAVSAHIKAYNALKNSKANGKAYFIGQGPVELWPFINEILAKHDLPPITKKISFSKAYRIGEIIEWVLKLLRIFNIHPPMSRFVALQLAKSHYFNHEQAHKDLGYRPEISVKDALERSFGKTDGSIHS